MQRKKLIKMFKCELVEVRVKAEGQVAALVGNLVFSDLFNGILTVKKVGGKKIYINRGGIQ